MCDYSLHHVKSRPARIGDELVTMKFPRSMTRGFAAASEPTVVVCLRPGTELAFGRPVEYEHKFGWLLPFLRGKIAGTLARFRKINIDRPDAHHDALEFADGTIVLLTRLARGQSATVLQMPPGQMTNIGEGPERLAEQPGLVTAP